MKVLVLNCGSSSIKYKLFDMDSKEVIAQGGIEKIGLKDSFLKLTLPNGEKKILEKDIPEHTVGGIHLEYTGKSRIWCYPITRRNQCRRSSYGARR